MDTKQVLDISNVSSSFGGLPSPLPPRTHSEPPPQYSLEDEGAQNLNVSDQWHSNDPRSSSRQSLVPVEAERNGRRTLLLIYIHGFMGTETSFQSFPAHVHNLMCITLAETHAVHTKIYPRYKSRKAIQFARDDFSKWLEPHEDATTDVILLGHSLGGILASEVALLPQAQGQKPLRHRILGTICFDTPFLGLHPGIVVSGIGSLFRPSASGSSTNVSGSDMVNSSLEEQSSSSSTLNHSQYESASLVSQLSPSPSNISAPPSDDPNYNPPFPNDVRIVERKGWSNMFHFVNKHAEGLTSATKQYFVSHLEFGGCLVDFPGLKARYSKIRRLEDVDEIASREEQRVRFTNYYTASSGRKPKEDKKPQEALEITMSNISLDYESPPSTNSAPGLENDDGDAVMHSDVIDSDQSHQMQHIGSVPMDDEPNDQAESDTVGPDLHDIRNVQNGTSTTNLSTFIEAQLPPLPSIPAEPNLVDLSIYEDKEARKVAEKEQKRVIRAYQQALKDRESAVKDRQRLVEKRKKKARQEQEKRDKSLQKQREKEEKEEQQQKEKEISKSNIDLSLDSNQPKTQPKIKPEKPKRDKKFCLLPSDLNGKKDTCWIRVYMEGVDEVGAHTGLFAPGDHYEGLIGEVGNRIEEWIKDDATRRMILEVEGS